MKYLLLPIALALASSTAFAQPQAAAPTAAAVATAGIEAPKPRISSRGEAIATSEFEHRMKMSGLVRKLEEVTIVGKIAKEEADTRKTRQGDEPSIEALVPRSTGARDSTAMVFPGVVPPSAANASSPAPVAPPSNPTPPVLQGIIGERAVFKNGNATAVVAIGGVFDGFRVEGIAGKDVKLRNINRPDFEVVLAVP